MCSCSVVVHNGEHIKSDCLHKKLPEEPVFREGNTLALLMPVEDKEENERTLTTKDGKKLAEEFMAYSRHNSDS